MKTASLVDDGIVARLGQQHFWVNTTSARRRSARPRHSKNGCNASTPIFKVLVTPVTSRWGNVTVAGPAGWDLAGRRGI